jgi:hypothetical protein
MQTFVPLMNRQINEVNRMEYLKRLRDLDCSRFYIALERAVMFLDDREKDLKLLKENLEFFENEGFEVAVWLQAYGFGEPLSPDGEKMTQGLTHIKNSEGETKGDSFCPEDEGFMALYLGFIKDIIRVSHPKQVMLDDDLCFSARNEIGCFCDNHLKLLSEKLREEVNPEDFSKKAFTGKKNRYRDAFLSVMGESHKKFCKRVREAADEIDPEVRIGYCAGFTSFDIEGVKATDLTRILAGKHEPFLRLSGAPYWVAKDYRRFFGQRLGAVIEFTRLQEKLCRDEAIPCFAEADCYPRPRYTIPANLIETFDCAVRASGGMDDLYYALDYHSSASYEDGYIKHHLKYRALHEFIEKHFSDKKAFGIKVCDSFGKFSDETLPETLGDPFRLTKDYSFSPAASLISSHSLPITYEEEYEVAAIFGTNALYIEKLPKKAIIDFKAAKILMEKGFDVGIKGYSSAPSPSFEVRENEKAILFNSGGVYYNADLKDGAKIISEFTKGEEKFPAAFTYQSGGTEFLCFAFDGESLDDASGSMLSYIRGDELFRFTENIPHIENCPSVYCIAKRNEEETALFFANLNEDFLIDFEINLGEEYGSFKSFGIEGELSGDRFIPSTDISPFGMFALVLRK